MPNDRGAAAELTARVATLRSTDFARHSIAFLSELGRLRGLARREAMPDVVVAAEALERALVRSLARDDGAMVIRTWLDTIEDAVEAAGEEAAAQAADALPHPAAAAGRSAGAGRLSA